MSDDLPTGIEVLDRLLEPAPAGSRIVLDHDPGVEAGPFAYEAAAAHAKAGRDVVYLVTDRSLDVLDRQMSDYDLQPEEGRVRFVDAHRAASGGLDPRAAATVDPSDPEAVAGTLEELAADDRVLVIDRLSTLRDRAGADAFEDAWERLDAATSGYGLTFAVFTRWPYEEELSTWLDLFDVRVAVRTVEGRVALTQYLRVERAAWMETLDDRPRMFRPVRPGGIRLYVPKITVTGPYNAGKSTFVQTVSERAVSVDREGTTVALDHGHTEADGVSADLFGTPGQARFDPVLDAIIDRGVGLLVMVDSSRPETYARAGEMLDRSLRLGVPALVVANKQDLDGAASPGELIDAMDLPIGIDVIGCQATDRDSCRRVLAEIVDRILGRDMLEEVVAA